MAERRMFSKSVIESDSFMDMPAEAQMLYIHLNMASDDDGFCDNPRAIMRQCGASNDSMKLLIAKKFVLTFDKNDGFLAVIKHWRINNYIRKDNYRETKYKEFMRDLYYDENRSYSMNSGDGHVPCIPASVTNPSRTRNEPVTNPSRECIQPVYEPYTNRIRTVHEPLTQDRIGKDSIDKVSLEIDQERKEGYREETRPRFQNEEEKLERIDFFIGRITFSSELNWNPDCWYSLANSEGISREEIDERIKQKNEEQQSNLRSNSNSPDARNN